MKELKPKKRIKNFDEVTSGFSEKEAVKEARRCLNCKKPVCIGGCPVGIDIPGFIMKVAAGDFSDALDIIKKSNNLPAICGRVCPQETQCEKFCILGKKGISVNIGMLERFASDNVKVKEETAPIKKLIIQDLTPKTKVAVIGSGPAGLTCAADLARAGFRVMIFEALHKPGGVLRYGIPAFRLPVKILDYEINYVKSLGVEISCNSVIGKTISLKDLFCRGFKAVFIGTGAGLPLLPNIPGINLCGIYSANEFLIRVNLMGASNFPAYDTPVRVGKQILVIGGGNTAIDAARAALRMIKNGVRRSVFGERGGKCGVTVLYRRTASEMPARDAEVKHAVEEGIKFRYLVQPVEFVGKNGYLKGVKCIKCRLSKADETGRPEPVPVNGSEFIIPADTVIVAIGLKPNKLLSSLIPGLVKTEEGGIWVNPETMETSVKNIYAGGDIVGGEGTVIEAMGMGKKAAASIVKNLK
jgi:glutamate synthase (NADPH/NADH) small chain